MIVVFITDIICLYSLTEHTLSSYSYYPSYDWMAKVDMILDVKCFAKKKKKKKSYKHIGSSNLSLIRV